MKPKLTTIDKFSGVAILVLVLGVISSFVDFGIISVVFSVSLPLIFAVNFVLGLYGIYKRKYFYLVGVVVFLICYNFFFQFSINTDKKTKDSISVISYNVRSFKQPVHGDSKQNAITEIK